MCRLLYVSAAAPFEIAPLLESFAKISKKSKEYQGHGWGYSIWRDDHWQHSKSIKPIWESDFSSFGEATRFIAHARSAFKDEGIVVENNMPFFDEKYVFIFNGELRGVRIKEEGRIGAEKVFNYLKRFDKGDVVEMLKRGTSAITKQTNYVRAMNLIIADNKSAYLSTQFNEDPDYFTMWRYKKDDQTIICSDRLNKKAAWEKIASGTIGEV